jgi:YegS/Rv2252/BmrU family lipid kinase
VRYLLVANPASGGGHNHRRLAKVLKYFRKKGDEVVLLLTSGPGEAGPAVRARSQAGFDAVIAAGGDGTLHEVLEGLAGTNVPLGILPWGTGNVFAREMGLPPRPKAQAKVIRRGWTRTLDLGLADGRPFLLMASWGLDAFALGRMPGPEAKRRWGLWTYLWAGLAALVGYRHPVLEVRLDDGRVDRGSFVLVSNTRLYGAFFVFHPGADPADGLLDVFVFRDSGRWSFLGMAAHMVWHRVARTAGRAPFLGRHGVYRVRSLEVVPGGARPAQVDGEHVPGGITRLSVAPGALRVLLPRP